MQSISFIALNRAGNEVKMDIRKLEQIADYYGTEKSRYRRNEKYSRGGHEVFTVPPFNSVWLSFRELQASEVMATKTNKDGVIQSWDIYDITKGYPKSLSVERLAEDGRTHISFSDNEQNIIQRFGEQGKEDTRQHLEDIIPLVRDKHIKNILISAEKKLGCLSDSNCKMLISYVKRRKNIESNRSVRKKLNKLKAEIKDRGSYQVREQDKQI